MAARAVGKAARGLASCLLACLVAGSCWAAKGHRYAIRAGKIVTITNGTINDGVILVRNGRIEAVGTADQVSVPRGYTAVDASGKWVMPGMVDIHCHIGVQGGLNDMVCQINPGMRIGDGLDPESEIVEAALAAGTTTVQAIPGSGTNHGGFGVVFKTAGATKQERLVRRVGVMKIAQADNPERRAGDIGATLMGMSWLLREHLRRAKEYDAEWGAYERGERQRPPKRDIALEDARLVFREQIPVIVHTWQTWGMSMTVRMFHDEFALPAIASHATGSGHRVAEVVAQRGLSVDVGPRIVDFYGVGDARFRGIVAAYVQGGVEQISVNTDGVGLYGGWLRPDYLALKAAMAARFGLDDETALKLMTINAARAILLDDRVGSIQVGKDADLVIKQTSLLDPTTPVEMVFVNGKIAYREEARN